MEEPIDNLILQLRDPLWARRSLAAEALGRIGDARAAEALFPALKDENEHVRHAAAEALAQIGPPAVPYLCRGLTDPSADLRVYSAEALGYVGDPRCIESLCLALGDSDERVRDCAVGALGSIGDARAVDPLCLALRDEDRGVRYLAAEALGQIGDDRAVGALCLSLTDDDPQVRHTAALALKSMGEAWELMRILVGEERLSLAERITGLHALRRLFRWPPVCEFLQPMTRDSAPRVREAARAILQAETLLRASPSIGSDEAQLLRPAAGSKNAGSPEISVRAAEAPQGTQEKTRRRWPWQRGLEDL